MCCECHDTQKIISSSDAMASMLYVPVKTNNPPLPIFRQDRAWVDSLPGRSPFTSLPDNHDGGSLVSVVFCS